MMKCFLEMYSDYLKSGLSMVMSNENILANDFSVYQNAFGIIERAKLQCNTQLERLWIKQEIEDCGKLGAWKRRMSELLRNDLESFIRIELTSWSRDNEDSWSFTLFRLERFV